MTALQGSWNDRTSSRSPNTASAPVRRKPIGRAHSMGIRLCNVSHCFAGVRRTHSHTIGADGVELCEITNKKPMGYIVPPPPLPPPPPPATTRQCCYCGRVSKIAVNCEGCGAPDTGERFGQPPIVCYDKTKLLNVQAHGTVWGENPTQRH